MITRIRAKLGLTDRTLDRIAYCCLITNFVCGNLTMLLLMLRGA